MVEGGERRAHAFSRCPQGRASQIHHKGKALVGQQAVAAILKHWLPRWQHPETAREPLQEWPAELPDLPPLTLRMLDCTLHSYPDFVGMGVDDFNARTFLQLEDDMRERLLDILRK